MANSIDQFHSSDSLAASISNSLDSHLERVTISPVSNKNQYATPLLMKRSVKVNTACALSSFAASPLADLVLLGGRDILKVGNKRN